MGNQFDFLSSKADQSDVQVPSSVLLPVGPPPPSLSSPGLASFFSSLFLPPFLPSPFSLALSLLLTGEEGREGKKERSSSLPPSVPPSLFFPSLQEFSLQLPVTETGGGGGRGEGGGAQQSMGKREGEGTKEGSSHFTAPPPSLPPQIPGRNFFLRTSELISLTFFFGTSFCYTSRTPSLDGGLR